MKQIINKYWAVAVLVFLIWLVFSGNGSVIYDKYFSKEIEDSNKVIKEAEINITDYVPKDEYKRKLDSLNTEIEHLKTLSNETVRYIYINSNFEDKYELLTSRISED